MINRKHEDTLLGQVLIDNSIWHSMKVTPEHFGTAESQKVYRAIEAVIGKGESAQLDTVYAQDKSIDIGYLSRLTETVPTAANWQFYETQLIEQYRKNAISRLLRGVVDNLPNESSENALTALDAGLTAILQTRSVDRIHHIGESCYPYSQELESRYKLNGKLPGIATGWESMDDKLLGYRGDRLYYICGRPSSGKSALLLGSARKIAESGMPVFFVSLESSRLEVMERMTAQSGRVDTKKLATGFFSQSDFATITQTLGRINEYPFYIYDAPNQSLNQIKSQCRRAVRQYDCKVIFVDYLQLIRVPGEQDRRGEVARASIEMKDLARELGVPIVCAAQLSRDADDKRPGMGSVQWSSQLEQDADAMVLIWRKRAETQSGGVSFEYFWCFEKVRDGSVGDVQMAFIPHLVSFEELARGIDRDAESWYNRD